MVSETPSALALPHRSEFQRLGVTPIRELHGGHQSRIVQATFGDATQPNDVVIKLTDARFVDPVVFASQVSLVEELSRRDDRVVGPLLVDASLINRMGDWFAVAYPLLTGRSLEITVRSDVEQMGRALARLHESLLPLTAELPAVAALRAVDGPDRLNQTNFQILHGDFSPSNVMLDEHQRLWILDFDDCGYGPVEFEVGNTLFMSLFATSPSFLQPSTDYLQFRKWLVGSYMAARQIPANESLIYQAVELRNEALRFWIDHLDQAPIGIRRSTPEWHDRLRAFTAS